MDLQNQDKWGYQMIRVAYIGASGSNTTSRHRAEALKRIGCDVILLDPYAAVARQIQGLFRSRFHFHTGYRFVQQNVREWCQYQLNKVQPIDLIWVDSGELLGSDCVVTLKSSGAPVVLFNHDDPTGPRDGQRFASLRKAISIYDVCGVCRQESKNEFNATGAQSVVLFTRGYDEIAHKPFEDDCEIPIDMRSEVAFVGTWMRGENRDRFLLNLIEGGIPISIWGDRWQKSNLWPQLSPYHRGGGLAGRKYVAALQGAKICLGLLSKGNRDLHTTRSVEIPYAGGLLCAERTSEHLQMYRENEEAVFWSDSQECIEKCRTLLHDNILRERIRANGRKRVLELQVGNETICRTILEQALKYHQ